MKSILRSGAIYSLSIFLVSLLFSGIEISGGFMSHLIAGLLLAIISTIIDPVVKILTLPFNLLTLGLLSFLTTFVSLYILTFFYSYISVSAFTFDGISFGGITIQKVELSQLLSFMVISATIYLLAKFLGWVFTK